MCVETSRLCHLSLYCLSAAHPPHFPPWWYWSWTWGRSLLCQLTSGKRKGFSVRCALASLLALRPVAGSMQNAPEHAHQWGSAWAPCRWIPESLAGTQQAASHRRVTAACLSVPQWELTGRHPARWAGTLGGFLASSTATSVGSIPLGPACSTSPTCPGTKGPQGMPSPRGWLSALRIGEGQSLPNLILHQCWRKQLLPVSAIPVSFTGSLSPLVVNPSVLINNSLHLPYPNSCLIFVSWIEPDTPTDYQIQ